MKLKQLLVFILFFAPLLSLAQLPLNATAVKNLKQLFETTSVSGKAHYFMQSTTVKAFYYHPERDLTQVDSAIAAGILPLDLFDLFPADSYSDAVPVSITSTQQGLIVELMASGSDQRLLTVAKEDSDLIGKWIGHSPNMRYWINQNPQILPCNPTIERCMQTVEQVFPAYQVAIKRFNDLLTLNESPAVILGQNREEISIILLNNFFTEGRAYNLYPLLDSCGIDVVQLAFGCELTASPMSYAPDVKGKPWVMELLKYPSYRTEGFNLLVKFISDKSLPYYQRLWLAEIGRKFTEQMGTENEKKALKKAINTLPLLYKTFYFKQEISAP